MYIVSRYNHYNLTIIYKCTPEKLFCRVLKRIRFCGLILYTRYISHLQHVLYLVQHYTYSLSTLPRHNTHTHTYIYINI